MSNEFLCVSIFDRSLIWIKKLADRTDFLDKDTNIAVFSSLVSLVLDLIKYRSAFLNEENKYKNVLAICL